MDLSALGAELGLEHVPASGATDQGCLRGSYRGYVVNVDPDEEGTLSVHFEGAPRVDLRSYRIATPVPFDMESVSSRDHAFNGFWKTRRAVPALASEIGERSSADWIEPFHGRYAPNVKSVIVTSEGITCEVDFGTPRCIPPDAVRGLLAACVSLAAQIEPRPEAPRDELLRDALAANRPDSFWDHPLRAIAVFAERRFERVLAATAVVALGLKLWLCLATYGTNDVYAFEQFATWSRYLGSGIYARAWDLNHPPLMLFVLRALDGLASASGISFAFWLRSLPTLADAVTLFLVYRLAQPSLGEWRTRAGLLLLAASPALIFISGFHGNMDSVMMALVISSVYLTERHESGLGAGIALGLAASVTIAPVLALPVLLLARPGWKRRLVFTAAATTTLGLCFVLLALPDLKPAVAQVFGYQSQYGHWGLSWFTTQFFGPDELPNRAFKSAGAYLLLAVVAGVSVLMSVARPGSSVYARVGVVFSLFLAASNAFCVQYLAWLAPLAVGLPLGPVAFHALASAGFLLVVYTYWSEGLPWFLADSNRIGDYRGHADYFQLLCWASVLVIGWCHWRRLSDEPRSAPTAPAFAFGALERRGLVLALTLLVAVPCALQLRKDANGSNHTEASLVPIRAKQYVGLSAILLGSGRHDEGIDIALRAANLDPKQPVAWNNLAAGYLSKQDWDAAIAAAERALRLDPAFQLAGNNLAWARAQRAKARNAGASILLKPR